MHLFFLVIFFTTTIISFAKSTALPCNRPTTGNDIIFPVEKGQREAVRLLSYNVRGDSVLDCEQGNSWDVRKHKIRHLIEYYQPDIIGLQGVSTSYMSDVELLFSQYTVISFNVNKKNKDVVLLVRMDRFLIDNTDYFWLSEEPLSKDVPQQPSWGGRSPRIAAYVTLRDCCTNKKFVFCCTHFDSSGMESRINSARVLVEQIGQMHTGIPLILTGDFNFIIASPIITKKSRQAYALVANSHGLCDVRDISGGKHYGPDGTWIGWEYDKYAAPPGTVGERLDNVFVRNCVVLKEGVLNLKVNHNCDNLIDPHHDEFKGSVYPSDHLPVIADVLVLG